MTYDSRTFVVATTRIAGLHHWPDAPGHRWYLRTPHRHLFHVKIEVAVHGDNRDLEFHDLLDALNDGLLDLCERHALLGALGRCCLVGLHDFGTRSCEQIARAASDYVRAQLLGEDEHTCIVCEVYEDGENGAVVVTP